MQVDIQCVYNKESNNNNKNYKVQSNYMETSKRLSVGWRMC